MKKQAFCQYFLLIVIAFATCSLILCLSAVKSCADTNLIVPKSDQTSADIDNITIIIDPGHGGRDGGASGDTGILEKDINLQISQKLGFLFDITNVRVVLTRTDDRMLYQDGEENRKKYYDLKNRADLSLKYENPVFISIHQNKFPMKKYKGLQVYYSPNHNDSGLLGEYIQDKTATYLQLDNDRKTKKAGRNIYLLTNIQCPSVLIECGFLSNPEDELNLTDDEYQKKLSFVIFSAVMDYISNKNSL